MLQFDRHLEEPLYETTAAEPRAELFGLARTVSQRLTAQQAAEPRDSGSDLFHTFYETRSGLGVKWATGTPDTSAGFQLPTDSANQCRLPSGCERCDGRETAGLRSGRRVHLPT